MKILHVYKTYLPDNFEGISRVIWEIAEGARAYGVESEVLSLSSDPWPSTVLVGHHLSHRAKQDLFIASTAISFSVLRRFRELAAGADLVHFHFPWPMADLMQVLGRHHRPAIATYHSDVVRQRLLGRLYRPLMHRFLGQLEAIVATSPAYAVTSPVLQLYSDKVRVIPLGISEAPPPDAARLAYWRDRLGTGFLLFVGALRYYKGLTFLNEAARLTALPVVVAGQGGLAEELKRTRPDNLILLGRVSDEDKAALLALCGVFVFPSQLRSEAFGVSLLEAAQASKPMISCEIGTGTSYVNVHGQTGLVVPPSDSPALAEAMTQLVLNEAERVRMGHNARQRYLDLFTSTKMAQAYSQVYRDVLSRPRR